MNKKNIVTKENIAKIADFLKVLAIIMLIQQIKVKVALVFRYLMI